MQKRNLLRRPRADFDLAVPSHLNLRRSLRFSCIGDRLNEAIADVVTFVSLFLAFGIACWFAVLADSPNRSSSIANQDVGISAGLIVLLALAISITVRRQRTLFNHLADAALLSAASVAGCVVMLSTVSSLASFGAFWATLLAVVTVVVLRLCFGVLVDRLKSHGLLMRRVAIYGATEESARCFLELAEPNSARFVGLFDERGEPERLQRFGIEVSGDLNDLLSMASSSEVDEIVIALPKHARWRAHAVAKKLCDYPVHLRWPVSFAGLEGSLDAQYRRSQIGTTEFVEVQQRPLEGWNFILKQVQDRLGALALLSLFSPIMAIIAIAIKIDTRGPVFFRQRRHGLCGSTITVWKFRTMRVLEDGASVVQACSNDPRVTRVGRILRKSSLDELPQLFNVLLGEMSLVGPRPHAIAHNEHYARIISTYNRRNKIKPGITGWAQVNGYRGETVSPRDMEKRVEYDHWYITNWSLWLDLKILLLTPAFGFVHHKAY